MTTTFRSAFLGLTLLTLCRGQGGLLTVTGNGKPGFTADGSPANGAVQVTNGSTVLSATAQAAQQSPSFFVFGAGPYVAATHASGAYIGPATLYPGLTTPVAPGEQFLVYGNGFGGVSSPIVDGAITQSGVLSPMPVIKIGGVTAEVTFAGLNVTPGEFQFNVVVPMGLSDGDQSIVATYNGLATQSGTLINVHH